MAQAQSRHSSTETAGHREHLCCCSVKGDLACSCMFCSSPTLPLLAVPAAAVSWLLPAAVQRPLPTTGWRCRAILLALLPIPYLFTGYSPVVAPAMWEFTLVRLQAADMACCCSYLARRGRCPATASLQSLMPASAKPSMFDCVAYHKGFILPHFSCFLPLCLFLCQFLV